jgi:diguanylate cyclase (GGDEF)-like protein
MLKRRVTESHRFGVRLSLMYLKIEEFDAVAKEHGKNVARQMLEVAEPALEKALREMDVLARLGNGEFIVMLPGNTAAESGQILKRMRITMSSLIVPLKDRELQIRFRHNIAELKPNETAQELVARAKQGLAVPPATLKVPATPPAR